ncbi:substrate-binding domain-containing protein (plasmid) [Bacillus sp. F19]|nr:substrate-binding domain-containing protein [Bacillus sp. F19]
MNRIESLHYSSGKALSLMNGHYLNKRLFKTRKPYKAQFIEQLKFMDKTITGKVDGIIIQGIAHSNFNQLTNKAFERGIEIVTVDTDVADSERKAFVGSDNYMAGVQAGSAKIEDTKGDQYVGIVTGRFDALNQQLRIKGFKDAIKKENRIKLVDIEVSNITKSGALQATYDLLKKHPHINAFYGTSALDGSGIAQEVVNQFNLKQRTYIIGFDILPQTLLLLEEGSIDASVVQYPYEMGYQSVEALLHLKNEDESKTLHHTLTKVIRPTDIQDFYEKGTVYENHTK